jgi:hypothetical protein
MLGLARAWGRSLRFAVPACALVVTAGALCEERTDDDWAKRPRVEQRCDMNKIAEQIRALYSCQSMAKPELVSDLYARRAVFSDPAVTLRGREAIRTAFDGMAVLMDRVDMEEEGVVWMPRDGSVQDPDIAVAWVTARYDVLGMERPFRSAVRLTFEHESCHVSEHEDLWEGKEFARRSTIGFLGNVLEMLRDINGIVLGFLVIGPRFLERMRRERSDVPMPFADGKHHTLPDPSTATTNRKPTQDNSGV